jgi:hypothetical protein
MEFHIDRDGWENYSLRKNTILERRGAFALDSRGLAGLVSYALALA